MSNTQEKLTALREAIRQYDAALKANSRLNENAAPSLAEIEARLEYDRTPTIYWNDEWNDND